ncbi:MAG: hypothetical protein WC614_09165 [bacterium]
MRTVFLILFSGITLLPIGGGAQDIIGIKVDEKFALQTENLISYNNIFSSNNDYNKTPEEDDFVEDFVENSNRNLAVVSEILGGAIGAGTVLLLTKNYKTVMEYEDVFKNPIFSFGVPLGTTIGTITAGKLFHQKGLALLTFCGASIGVLLTGIIVGVGSNAYATAPNKWVVGGLCVVGGVAYYNWSITMKTRPSCFF